MTNEKCDFCNSGRALKIGYVLKELKTREKVISSTHCYNKIEEKIINKNEITPNLTKGIISNNSDSKFSTTKSKNKGNLKDYQILNIFY